MKSTKYTKGIIIEPLMDTNGHESREEGERGECVDGARARRSRRASIGEERTTIFYCFRVFRAFRGLKYLLVSISGSNIFLVSISVH